MIPSFLIVRSCRPKSTRIPPSSLSRLSAAAIAASFQNTLAASASGPSNASSISAPLCWFCRGALCGGPFQARLPKRLFQRDRKPRRQESRLPLRRNHHVVLASHPELTGNIDPWLIRKRHPRLQRCLASSYQIRMLVAIESNAMPQSVREILVVRSVAGVGDHFARSIIYCARQPPSPSRIERSILPLAHDLVDTFHFFWRFTNDSRARDVRLVPLNCAASVYQHYIAVFQFLRL